MSKETCLPTNLRGVSKEEQKQFLDSFDTVFSDVDGVLWHFGQKEIEGSPECIEALRQQKKNIYIVSNNTTITPNRYAERLKNFKVKESEIFTPASSIIYYLKKINFDKEVMVLGMNFLKEELRKAGIKIHEEEIQIVEESINGVTQALKLNPNVGAILVDIDVNLTFIKLQKAVEYIKKTNALFLVGCWEPNLQFLYWNFIGPYYFVKALEDLSGKKPTYLAKPGSNLNNSIQEKVGPLKNERVLFIGDSVMSDMAFAQHCNYQKLLVLSGNTTKEDLLKWNYPEEFKPMYYVDSLDDLNIIVTSLTN